jgi:hypothetical protein
LTQLTKGMYMELLQAWGNNGSVDSYNMAITPPNILKKEQPTLVFWKIISVRMLRLVVQPF